MSKTKESQTTLNVFRMFLASTFLDWSIRLIPVGTKGRKEAAFASIVFHEGLMK